MKSIEEMVKEKLEDVNRENEQEVENKVNNLIDFILTATQKVNSLTADIAAAKQAIKELKPAEAVKLEL